MAKSSIPRGKPAQRPCPKAPSAVSRWRRRYGYDLYEGWPPSAEQQARARDSVAFLERRYRKSYNPVHVGRAWLSCRAANIPFPEWVLDYLDRAFGNVQWLLQLQTEGALRIIEGNRETRFPFKPIGKTKIAPAIAAAFGFVPGGVYETERHNHDPRLKKKKPGAFNPLNVDDLDALAIAGSVGMAIHAGSQLLYAYQEAAKKHGVAQRTAERAWKQYPWLSLAKK